MQHSLQLSFFCSLFSNSIHRHWQMRNLFFLCQMHVLIWLRGYDTFCWVFSYPHVSTRKKKTSPKKRQTQKTKPNQTKQNQQTKTPQNKHDLHFMAFCNKGRVVFPLVLTHSDTGHTCPINRPHIYRLHWYETDVNNMHHLPVLVLHCIN